MSRPATKTDLLKAAEEQFAKMWRLIDSMSDAEQKLIFCFGSGYEQKEAHWKRDKNLRDVLVHLYEWHQLLLAWVATNLDGEARPFLPEPYNWKTYAQMNVGFWEKHQSTEYSTAEALLRASHKQIIENIHRFTNEELFEAMHFSWTGTTSLGAYFVSATSSHYDWAMKKLKVHIRQIRS